MAEETTNQPEEKDDVQKEMERISQEKEQTIVRFKNIDSEPFEHAFRGISIKVGAGRELPCSLPQAEHLATHLARKMLSRKKKEELKGKPVAQQQTHLWEQEEVDELIKSMVISIAEQPEELETSPAGTQEEAPQPTGRE